MTTVRNVNSARLWIPAFGPLDPGATIDVPDELAEQLCAGGILAVDPPKKKKRKSTAKTDPSGSAGEPPEEGTES